MKLPNALTNIGTSVSNNISFAKQKASNGASNVSFVVTNVSSKIIKGASNFKANVTSSVKSSLTISEKNRKRIGDAVKKLENTMKKILAFVIKNRSLIFFGLTVWFSYYMAPAAAFEYLAKTGFSLTSSFVSGIFLGTGLLALKNILFPYPIRNPQENNGDITQDDKINYLLGISNICLTYLNPALSLGAAIGLAGLVTAKSAYKLFPADEIKKTELTFLVPKTLTEKKFLNVIFPEIHLLL